MVEPRQRCGFLVAMLRPRGNSYNPREILRNWWSNRQTPSDFTPMMTVIVGWLGPEAPMITQGQARSFSAFRLLLLAALMPSGLACVGVGKGDGGIHGGEGRMVEEQIRLPDAEQMIDELDRMLTANGTIGVKSPDVWGQDRLAKFRSEYETQMSEWLKTSFKGDINAVVRRSESEARRLYLGASTSDPALKPASETNTAAAGTNTAAPGTATKPTATAEANAAAASPAEKGP